MKRKQTELNPKQRRFVEEYLIDLNAKRSATVAGYSAKSAAKIGYRLLREPLVAKAMHKALAARSRRTHITADRGLREDARIAVADIRKFTTREPCSAAVSKPSDGCCWCRRISTSMYSS